MSDVHSTIAERYMSQEKTVVADLASMPSDDRVSLSVDEISRIDTKIEELFSLPSHSPEFTRYTDQFHTRILTDTLVRLEDNEASNANLAMELLDDLRVILNSLFPNPLPQGWSLRDTLDRNKDQVNKILSTLKQGQKFIVDDLDSIDLRSKAFHDGIVKLRRSIVAVTMLRTKIEARCEAVGDRQSAAIKENVVFYLVQREIDLMTELAVTTQSYLAMKAIRKTNVILNHNIDRILTITVQAVNNAVFVASNIQATSLDYVFDTRKFLLGFEGQQVKEMCARFYSLDKDLAQISDQVKEAKKAPEPRQKQQHLQDFHVYQDSFDDFFMSYGGGSDGGSGC